MYCRKYTGTVSHVLCRGLLYCVLTRESPLSEAPLQLYLCSRCAAAKLQYSLLWAWPSFKLH